MNPEQKLELAAQILNRGKALTPDRFPKPDPATAQAWADAMGRVFDSLPIGVWPEAVGLWAAELVTDRMITPKELKQAAYAVRDRWETDPRRRDALRAHRDARQSEIDRQLGDGTFAAIRGYQAPKARPAVNVPNNIHDAIKETLK